MYIEGEQDRERYRERERQMNGSNIIRIISGKFEPATQAQP